MGLRESCSRFWYNKAAPAGKWINHYVLKTMIMSVASMYVIHEFASPSEGSTLFWEEVAGGIVLGLVKTLLGHIGHTSSSDDIFRDLAKPNQCKSVSKAIAHALDHTLEDALLVTLALSILSKLSEVVDERTAAFIGLPLGFLAGLAEYIECHKEATRVPGMRPLQAIN